jgi:hypothetical protein
MPRKSLMHHDIQKIICYHDLYIFFPICKEKEFKLLSMPETPEPIGTKKNEKSQFQNF